MRAKELVVMSVYLCLGLAGSAQTQADPAAMSSQNDVSFGAVFRSNMVLQRDRPLKLWGWARPGQEVRVSGLGEGGTVYADKSGEWCLPIAALKAGGPYRVTVSGNSSVSIENVMIGDVWLCAGQSNMQLTVAESKDGRKDLEALARPDLRLCQMKRGTAREPLNDVSEPWTPCSAKNAANFSAVAFFYGTELSKEVKIPMGLIESSWGGTPIEPWMPGVVPLDEETFAREKAVGRPTEQATIYNAMIAPLTGLPIRGVIWYQGESNVRRPDTYGASFKTMIRAWRRAWNQEDLPFGFVQIAPYNYANLPDWHGTPQSLPKLREGQAEAVRELPNVGMVVVTDLASATNIHPQNKKDVARRLARWALATTYGRKGIKYENPTFKRMTVEGSRIRVRFDNVGEGLVSQDHKALTCFQIAGEDQRFTAAEAVIDGDSVIVSSPLVSRPVAVRFAYVDVAEPNLFNRLGMPVAPFRTDGWALKSAGPP